MKNRTHIPTRDLFKVFFLTLFTLLSSLNIHSQVFAGPYQFAVSPTVNVDNASRTAIFPENAVGNTPDLDANLDQGEYLTSALASDGVTVVQDLGVVATTALGSNSYTGSLLNLPSPTIVDTDGDGVNDVFDLDDDNDGIIDFNEMTSNTIVGSSYSFPNSGTYIILGDDGGLTIDVERLDNSFNMNINGTDLVSDEVQFSPPGYTSNQSLARFASDGLSYQENGITSIWNISGIPGSPALRLVINPSGEVSLYGRRTSGGILELMYLQEGHPQFNTITLNESSNNNIVISQLLDGQTYISGSYYFSELNYIDKDTDGDAIPDHLDLDSDNDGTLDNIEAQETTSYIPPSGVANGITDVNNNGLDDVYESSPGVGLIPIDSDTDGLENFIDIDTDNDGCSDTIEAGTSDDGTTTDANNNGLLDQYEDGTTGTINYASTYSAYALNNAINACADSDSDGVADATDLDDDNDGILDVVESLGICNNGGSLNFEFYATSPSGNTVDNIPTTGAIATGTIENFNVSALQSSVGDTGSFAVRYTGYISITTNGTYTFFTSSDDGSKLLIDGVEIVNNDGSHAAQERSG
ncbi:PA14 domain-containing protein, partial [Flavobacteriaceae bacterium]|nr:PA14 domain-containing protein [Flavobacteriaceae bacterium]